MHIKQVFNTCLFLLITIFTAQGLVAQDNNAKKGVKIRISTPYGNIVALLYDDTPVHRENFVKNIKEKVYDSLLFHRVINEFMIQGGDPESKNAKAGQVLGNGGLGYTIPAEFNPTHFHKKGVLAAARQSDNVNPNKESSSSQFYIVQGKVYTDTILSLMEKRMNDQKKNEIFNRLLQQPGYEIQMKTVQEAVTKKDNTAIQKIYLEMEKDIHAELEKSGKVVFSKEQREAYTTVGGAPHLDGGYTVFGEVTEGLDVIDKIATVEVDGMARPVKDIKFTITLVQ